MMASIADPQGNRQADIACGAGVQASLTYYAPSTRQAPHRHDFTQLSFLLSGVMLERLDGRDYELDHCAVGVKPAGSLHEDRWGRDGVLIFSLKLPSTLRDVSPVWSRSTDPRIVGALARRCLLAPEEVLRAEAAIDLLALTGRAGDPASSRPPAWLAAVRAQIVEAPHSIRIDGAAGTAGIDRAHLSRMFRRFFGVPPSIFRQRCLAARAVRRIAQADDPLSMVAAETGFADQSHFNRRIKAQTGLAPGQLRHLLRRADHIGPIQR